MITSRCRSIYMYVHKIHDYAAHGAQLLWNTSHKNECIIQSLQLLPQPFDHKKNLLCLLSGVHVGAQYIDKCKINL